MEEILLQHLMTLESEVTKIKKQLQYWECTKELYDEKGDLCFIKGEVYTRIDNKELTFKDFQGEIHNVGKWRKYFKLY
jgi:hypothetical protein